MINSRRTLLLATCLATTAVAYPALAQSAGDAGKRIDSIQSEISQLQQELKRMRSELAARDGQVRAAQTEATRARTRADQAATQAQAAQTQTTAIQAQTTALQAQASALPAGYPAAQRPAASGPGVTGPGGGTFNVGGVRVTLGGFLAAEGVYRTRNLTSDIGSTYNGIPLPNSSNYHTGEFRGSARQTRISLLAEGDIAADQKVTGYYESDFLGVGTTSNSNESNSYVPRLRQAYMTYDNTTLGVHFLAGQAWSLLTLNRVGITPRQENVPLTIDAQYVPGFNWKRQWQVRADADFLNHAVWLGASIEEPQSTFYTGPNGLGVAAGTALINNAGSSLLNSTTTYSDDVAPDVIVKAAFDPGWGHYEVFGLAKFIHDRVSFVGSGQNNTTLGGGVGGGFILPLIPKVLDLQFSGMTGYGVGTYGSGQLPDAILSPSGAPKPLPSYSLLGGLTAHPTPAFDLYTYVGTEQVQRTSFDLAGKAYGYGNPLYSNAGCSIELSTATCTANTSGISQATVGAWWRFMKGNYGTLQAGAQYSYTRRTTFSGGGPTAKSSSSPTTDDNIMLFSFRYLPFQ